MKLTTEGKRGVPRRIPGQYPRGSNARTRRPGIRGTRPGLSRARRRRRPRPSASGIWKGRFSSRDELPKVPKDFFCFFAKQPNNRVGSENTRVCVAFTLQVCRDLMPAYDWRRSDWTTSNKIQARTVLGARAITTDAEGYRPPPVNARARTLPLEPHGATRPFASTRDDTHAPPRTRAPACRDVNFPIGNPRCPLRALITSRA
jgi:hypothetical protein